MRKPNKPTCYVCSCGTAFTLKRRASTSTPPQCPNCIKSKANARARVAEYYKRPVYKEKSRAWRLRKYYGLSVESYEKIAERQGNVCAICKTTETLVVDHNHSTGKVRGLLCQKCNMAIGSLGDNLKTIRAAVSYLQRTDESRSWDSYFVDCARLAATRSKDPSSQVGAVIVRDRIQLSTGYNGFPRGVNDNITERYDRPLKYSLTVHAEENAILNAGRIGIATKDSSLYVTPFHPCVECAKAIIQAGIVEVIVDNAQDNPRFEQQFQDAAELLNLGKVLVRKAD